MGLVEHFESEDDRDDPRDHPRSRGEIRPADDRPELAQKKRPSHGRERGRSLMPSQLPRQERGEKQEYRDQQPEGAVPATARLASSVLHPSIPAASVKSRHELIRI